MKNKIFYKHKINQIADDVMKNGILLVVIKKKIKK